MTDSGGQRKPSQRLTRSLPACLFVSALIGAGALSLTPAFGVGDGPTTSPSDYRSVGIIRIPRTDGGGARCTGTLVAPNVVITVKHCTASHKEGGMTMEFHGSRMGNLSNVREHPDADLAMVRMDLVRCAPRGGCMPPPTTADISFDVQPEESKVTAVGYGPDPDKKAQTQGVGTIPKYGHHQWRSDGWIYDVNGVNNCPGDSGGQLLNADLKVIGAGVKNWHEVGKECGTKSAYIALADYKDWIQTNLAELQG